MMQPLESRSWSCSTLAAGAVAVENQTNEGVAEDVNSEIMNLQAHHTFHDPWPKHPSTLHIHFHCSIHTANIHRLSLQSLAAIPMRTEISHDLHLGSLWCVEASQIKWFIQQYCCPFRKSLRNPRWPSRRKILGVIRTRSRRQPSMLVTCQMHSCLQRTACIFSVANHLQ